MKQLLKHRVSVERQSVGTPSSTGVVPQSWATVATNVPALLHESSGERVVADKGAVDKETLNAYFLIDTDVLIGDRVVWNEKRYRVDDISKPRNHHIESKLIEV